MPSLTLKIPHESPLDRKIKGKLQQFIKWSMKAQSTQHDEWQKAEESMLAYVPASEADRRREHARDQGDPRYTTIVLPYSYAVTMAAHTYWTSVFYARDPIFQFTGRHGETQQQVQALDSIVSYQTLVGGHLVPHYSWLYDAGRYGFGVMGLHWEKEVRHVAIVKDTQEEIGEEAVDADQLLFGDVPDGGPRTKRIIEVQEVETYEGNKVYNVSPWNFLPDPRVPLLHFQKGEFVNIRTRVSWNQILYRKAQGLYINTEKVKTGHGGDGAFGDTQGTTTVAKPHEYYFMDKENDEGGHPSTVNIYEVYVELVPSEWGLGKRDYPEKWVFSITQDYSILLGATPLDSYHCKFPFMVIPIDPDGHALFARGYPKIMQPIQDTMTWLLNSHFFNVRAALQNLFIVDPSKVSLADLEDPLPGGIIRVRDVYYGQDVRTAVHQVDIKDVTQQNLSEIQFMQGIGERIGGVNDQVMGALAGGGRRTATEVRSSTGFSVNRLKTTTEFMSAAGMAPLSQMTVMNTQQFYTAEKKFRIAGSLLADAEPFVSVDPKQIQGFYDYVPVDGTMPIDRLAQAKMWQEIFATMKMMPEVAVQYDIGRMFAWVASLAGMKNINQFKINLMDPQEIQKQTQLGNLIQQQALMRTPPKPGNSSTRGQQLTAPDANGSGGSGPVI